MRDHQPCFVPALATAATVTSSPASALATPAVPARAAAPPCNPPFSDGSSRRPRSVAWLRPGTSASINACVLAAAGPSPVVVRSADAGAALAAARTLGAVAVFTARSIKRTLDAVLSARFASQSLQLIFVLTTVSPGRSAVPSLVNAPLGVLAVSSAIASVAVPKPVIVELKNGRRLEYSGDCKMGSNLTQLEEVDERSLFEKCISILTRVYLPDGYPSSVSPDYWQYTKYRIAQNIASAVMAVLSARCLLFGLGLGNTAAAAGAAASAWVAKDGLGYITKVLASNCFTMDSDPKSYRIAGDVAEDVAGAVEVMMPVITAAVPGSFIVIASLTNVVKGLAALSGTATRHIIFKQLVAGGNENIGDVGKFFDRYAQKNVIRWFLGRISWPYISDFIIYIPICLITRLAVRAEAQGVSCKLVGLGTGIVISSVLGQNYAALLGAYAAVSVAHIAANVYSMRCVQFRFMNKQRLALTLEAIFNGKPTPTPEDVSKLERIIFPPWIGFEGNAVEVGSSVSNAVLSVDQFRDAASMFKGEQFVITRTKNGKLHVLLHRNATSVDSARAYYVVQKLRHGTGCNGKNGSSNITRLPTSSYNKALILATRDMRSNFDRFIKSCRESGWTTDRFVLANSAVRIDW
jgi:Vitamin B6 photo-protection and homoeostasis